MIDPGLMGLLKTWWAGVFVPLFLYMFKKQADTYTKAEADKQVELRIAPLKHSLDRNTVAVEKLSETLTNVRLEVAHKKDA